MQNVNSASELKDSILFLESRQAEEGKILKEQFNLTAESLNPINLIKNSFKEVVGSEDTKGNILNTSVGLTAGYLSKMLFERISNNPFKRLLGTALLFGVTNIIAKNPGIIKSVGRTIFSAIRRKPGVRKTEISNEGNTY